MPTIAILGTCDTKLEELLFLHSKISNSHATNALLIDVGRTETEHETIGISQKELLQKYGNNQEVDQLPRAKLIEVMADCATKAVKVLLERRSIHGIIAAGGSCGTSLASAVMRDAVPIGFPKMIVSTVASGDTGPIVGETDITMMYSVVDIAGLNQVLQNILSNAAAAIAGMAASYADKEVPGSSASKKRVGITMFGVTTPAVDVIRRHLEAQYGCEIYVFHATGHGGQAMERLVRENALDAVLDLTTTEVCDFLTGGVMSAGPRRLDAAAEAGIPNIVSVGATDMTNFGPKSTVPERYKDRRLYEHNPVVTLMRTSEEEARQVGNFIAEKLKKHVKRTDLVQVWLPDGGISLISTPEGPFADPKADTALFRSLKEGLDGSGIEIVEDKRSINDPGFATDIAEALMAKTQWRRKS